MQLARWPRQKAAECHTHTSTQRNNQQKRLSGYAPCGSVLVITLLQKYRFPLIPRAATPPQHRQAVLTQRRQTARRPAEGPTYAALHSPPPPSNNPSAPAPPSLPPSVLPDPPVAALGSDSVALSTGRQQKKVLQQHLQRHDISFKLSQWLAAGQGEAWVRASPAGWGWPAGLEVGVSTS